jgi:hypothetical protein
VAKTSTIDYKTVEFADMSSLNNDLIDGKMFDVPCSSTHSFICSLYFSDQVSNSATEI